MLIVDSGLLSAYYDRRDAWHSKAVPLLDSAAVLLLPAPVIPEVDYFLGRRLGIATQLAFYEDITSGVYQVVDLSPSGYKRALELNRQYRDLHLGFVDAAVIAIAEELRIGRIATTDRRHFGAVEARIPLVLLP